MKKIQGLLASILVLGLTGHHLSSSAQSEVEVISIAQVDEPLAEPLLLDPDSTPVYGTFYMLSDFLNDYGTPPPYPGVPFSNVHVYSTAAEGIYVVDDSEARPEAFQLRQNSAITPQLIWNRVQSVVGWTIGFRMERELQLSQMADFESSGLMLSLSDSPAAMSMESGSSLPVLSIATLGGNQFSITVTNGVSTDVYELHWKPILNDSAYPWQLISTGEIGQTNWIFDGRDQPTGYFRASLGGDWDGDGIPNWLDADPETSGVGALTITIDSPSAGFNFN